MALAPFFRAAAVGLLAAAAYAQPVAETRAPAPALEGLAPLGAVPILETPPVNAVASRSVDGPGEPYRFAEPFAVDVTPATHGLWETTSDGRTAVWRLRVRSAGAVSINLGFTRYSMPPGGRLRVHTPDGEDVVGPYTEADNKSHGQLWTPLVPGDDAVIEVAAPAGRAGELELRLGSVNRGFRDLVATDPFREHGSCNIDVACSQADPYRDQVRSVARITTNGAVLCSGSLLNNTGRDLKPYFLTARHCFRGEVSTLASTVVVYWNYQRTECGSGEGTRDQTQSGAILRAEYADSDAALLELDDEPDAAFNVYFAGWNRGASPPTSAVTIHHPAGHVKSISLEHEALTVTTQSGNTSDPSGRYLRVAAWDQGTTEGGSSGGPLFDENKRVVGQLCCGAARCSVARPDWYGRLGSAWSGGGSASTRLSDWLDPAGAGVTVFDGMNQNAAPQAVGTLDDKAIRLADGAVAGAVPVDVAAAFRDREGDDITYSATSSDESIATVTVEGSTVTVAPASAGTSTIQVTATQVGSAERAAMQAFDVTVGANRSPDVAATIADLSFPIGAASESVDAASAFLDVDGDDLTYEASSSDASVATVAISGSTVTVTPVLGGTATITVGARDVAGSNTRTRQTFDAVVASRPPIAVGSLPRLNTRPGENSERDLSVFFSDPEGDELAYAASSSDTSVVEVSVSDSTVTVTGVAAGTATITVTATDVDGSNTSATQTFDVTVENSPPLAVGTLAALTLEFEDGDHAVTVSGAFRDPDGDDLTYSATSSNLPVATVAASGSTVTVTPLSSGTATITVTATDVDGTNTSASQTFEVVVPNRAPLPVGSLVGPDLQVGDGNDVVEVADAFEDPENDALTYGASSSAPGVAGAAVSGSRVTLTPLARGRATITVTATDVTGSNTQASQQFDVRVKARRGVTVSTAALTVTEGSTETYTVVLDSEPTGEVVVTATVPANTDVTVDPPALTFTIGDWQTPQSVVVEAEEDLDSSADPAVMITHQVSGSDYGSVRASSLRVTIVETGPSTLSVTAAEASESSSSIIFEVTLSRPSTSEITVDYATSNDSGSADARAGSDYTAASGTLTFPVGLTTVRQIVVDLIDDTEDEEEEETFRLTLGNPQNAELAGGGSTLQVTGTIRDDDDPEVDVSFGSSSYGVAEGRAVDVVVRLNRDPERDLEIFLEETLHGGAADADYSGVPLSVAFGPGVRRQQFQVAATDDTVDDDGEAVVLSFVSLPSRVSDGGETTIAITDNDGSVGGGGPPPGGGGGGPPPGGGSGPPPGGGDDGPPPGGGDDGGPPPDGGDGGDDDDDDDDDDGGGVQPPPPPAPSGPPKADFTLTAECAEDLCRARTGLPVTFEDTSTGRVQSRRWDFGDGTGSRNRRIDHVWSSPGFYVVTLSVSDGTTESTARQVFLVEAGDPAGTCVSDAETLCLQDSRYAVTVDWRTAAGSGGGSVVHAGTNDSGLFTFFDRNNWEVLIKVLDGCALNGHVWVFGASTTDLGYVIRVTDTATGTVKEYRNEPGTPAPAITDTRAFAEGCRPQ